MVQDVFSELIDMDVHSLNSFIDGVYQKVEENGKKAFVFFLKTITPHDVDFESDSDVFEELDGIIKTHIKIEGLVTLIIDNLVNRRVSEQEFYDVMWEEYTNDRLIFEKESKKAFLVFSWLSNKIPYYQLKEGLFMEEPEFAERNERISEIIKRADFIINAGMPQRTQVTSLLIDETKKISDEKDIAVFWAHVLMRVEAKNTAVLGQEDETEN